MVTLVVKVMTIVKGDDVGGDSDDANLINRYCVAFAFKCIDSEAGSDNDSCSDNADVMVVTVALPYQVTCWRDSSLPSSFSRFTM